LLLLLLLLLLCLQVKLIDLGMAGLYRPKQPMHGCMGSPGFIAPEVILGEAHSVSRQQYSWHAV
jgi:serine/threonine protein kinase